MPRQTLMIAAVLVVSGCLMLFLGNNSSHASTAPEPTRWEYKVVHIEEMTYGVKDPDGIVNGLQNSLNSLGGERWEVCLEVRDTVIMKRQK